jgi:hypothetical protein
LVGRSGAPPLTSIAAYLNLDMLGSPNGGRFVYALASGEVDLGSS